MGLLGPLVEIEITDILSTPQKVLDWETRYEPYLAIIGLKSHQQG